MSKALIVVTPFLTRTFTLNEDGTIHNVVTKLEQQNITRVDSNLDGLGVMYSHAAGEYMSPDEALQEAEKHCHLTVNLNEGEELITGPNVIISRRVDKDWEIVDEERTYKLGEDTQLETLLRTAYPNGIWVNLK